MTTVLIGIDDTDNATSKGTGHLARMLARECRDRGLRPTGVTRHQFPLDPRIPYTSHNSGACVAVEAAGGPAEAAFAFAFVAERSAPGSDPGVCVAAAEAVPAAIIEFGERATREVVDMSEALRLAEDFGIGLQALGGTGLGVIGALASVGLRAQGREGRFIDLPGLRELADRIRCEAVTALGIQLEHESARRPRPTDAFATLNWVRPRLAAGSAVLPVEWSEQYDAWIPVDRKQSRPLE